MKLKDVKQRQVYMCSLNDGLDHEQKGVRPCIVLSVDVQNENSDNIIIVSITHKPKKHQPTHWYLYSKDYDFFKFPKNIVLGESIRSISKNRLQRYIGEINYNDFYEILECIKYNFEIIK